MRPTLFLNNYAVLVKVKLCMKITITRITTTTTTTESIFRPLPQYLLAVKNSKLPHKREPRPRFSLLRGFPSPQKSVRGRGFGIPNLDVNDFVIFVIFVAMGLLPKSKTNRMIIIFDIKILLAKND